MPVKSEKMGKSMKYARAGLQFHALHIDSDKLTPPCLCLRSVINRPLFSIQKKVITLSFFWAWNVYLSNQLSASFQHKLRLDFRVFFNTFLSLREKLLWMKIQLRKRRSEEVILFTSRRRFSACSVSKPGYRRWEKTALHWLQVHIMIFFLFSLLSRTTEAKSNTQ